MAEEPVSIGEYLRRARLLRRLSLDDVSEELHIRLEYLQALEHDDWDRLPGEVYGQGFLRSYARYLDLDADALVQHRKQQIARPLPAGTPDPLPTRRRSASIEPLGKTKALVVPKPSPRSNTSSNTVVAVALVLAGLFVAGIYLLTQTGHHPAPAAKPPTAPVARVRAKHPAAAHRASVVPIQLLATNAGTASASYGVGTSGPVTVALTFSGPCWVEVWENGVTSNPSGHTYEAGQSVTVSASRSVGLKLGTRAVTLVVNGQSQPLPFPGQYPITLTFQRE